MAAVGKPELEMRTRRTLLRAACGLAACGWLRPANALMDHIFTYRIGGGPWQRLTGLRFERIENEN